MSDNVAHALAGAGGGLLAMLMTYPLITISTRAQTESKKAQSSTIDAIKRIVERDGLSGLYSGLESALFGITVTNATYYYCYELTKSLLMKTSTRNPRSTLTTVESTIAGAVAGSGVVVLTNPIWVVNTRMTTRKVAAEEFAAEKGGAMKVPTTYSTVKSILKRDGILAFWNGVIPALVLVLNPILQYTIFERLKAIIERKRAMTPNDAFFLGAIGKIFATGVTYPYLTIKSLMQMRQSDKLDERYTGLIMALRKVIREKGWLGLYKGIGPKLVQSVLTAAFLFMQVIALVTLMSGSKKRSMFMPQTF